MQAVEAEVGGDILENLAKPEKKKVWRGKDCEGKGKISSISVEKKGGPGKFWGSWKKKKRRIMTFEEELLCPKTLQCKGEMPDHREKGTFVGGPKL